jgi:Domain of unknown function (DUF4388)
MRIGGDFDVRIVGLDDVPRRRRGNISVTGVYFEVDDFDAEPGTVERLELSSTDGNCSVVCLACLARVMTVVDLWETARVTGVAFQFLPGDEAMRQDILGLVSHVARQRLLGDEVLLEQLGLDASLNIGTEDPRTARIQTMRSTSLVLETEWPVERGARVGLAIEASEGAQLVRIQGVVDEARSLSCDSDDGQSRYRVQVALTTPDPKDPDLAPETSEPAGATLDDAFASLLDNLLKPDAIQPPLARAPHIAGDLGRVAIASVLSLLEVERMTGSLRLLHNAQKAVLFVKEGRMLDAELVDSDEKPLEVLELVLQWERGSFRFVVEEVDRPDLLRMTTTALILDALREVDENSRSG